MYCHVVCIFLKPFLVVHGCVVFVYMHTHDPRRVLLPLRVDWNDRNINLAEMGAIERQFTLLEKYNPTVELVADYIELFIQFG